MRNQAWSLEEDELLISLIFDICPLVNPKQWPHREDLMVYCTEKLKLVKRTKGGITARLNLFAKYCRYPNMREALASKLFSKRKLAIEIHELTTAYFAEKTKARSNVTTVTTKVTAKTTVSTPTPVNHESYSITITGKGSSRTYPLAIVKEVIRITPEGEIEFVQVAKPII